MPPLGIGHQSLLVLSFAMVVLRCSEGGKTIQNRIQAKSQSYCHLDSYPKTRRVALSINGKNGKQKAYSLYHYYSNSNSNNRATLLRRKKTNSMAQSGVEGERNRGRVALQ